MENLSEFDFQQENSSNHNYGAGLLRYDLSKRDDCVFLADVRALFNQFDFILCGLNGSNNNNISIGSNNGCSSSIDHLLEKTTNSGLTDSNDHNMMMINLSASIQNPTNFSSFYKDLGSSKLSNLKLVGNGDWIRIVYLRIMAACQVLSVTHYLNTQKPRNLVALFRGRFWQSDD